MLTKPGTWALFPGLGWASAACESAGEHRPRCPEESVLYGVVAGHVEAFLARQWERDRLVPRFVEMGFRSFLDCGILARGFLRVHCDVCRLDRLVPYSCKCRRFCPSCCGRRMANTAAHLVGRVFPEVPVRQWVLSVPFGLRYLLAYDSFLVGDVLQIWLRAVFASIRRRAGIPASNRRARCGAVTFIQRFSDTLNLDPHFHTIVLDGIYVENGCGRLVFRHVPSPGDAEVALVVERVRRSVARLMERRGLGPQADPGEDALRHDKPLLAEIYGALISGRIATGPRRQAHRESGRCCRCGGWHPAIGPVLCSGCGPQRPCGCARSRPRPKAAGTAREICGPPSAGWRTAVAFARRPVAVPAQAPLAGRNDACHL